MENGEAPQTIEEKGLTVKQKRFAEEYLVCLNASKAALNAGYSPKTAYQIGHENLKIPKVRRYIDERLNSSVLGKQEVLTLFSRQATADIADVLEDDGSIDLKAAKSRGMSHLIKKVRTREIESKETGKIERIVEVELHDQQHAAVQLGKFHKLFTQKVELDATLFFDWSDIVRDAETENEHSRHITESGLQDHSDSLEA